MCRYCSQPGHKEERCDAKQELEEFGVYRHDIAEGRIATQLEKQRPENGVFNDTKSNTNLQTDSMAIPTVTTVPVSAPVTSSSKTPRHDETNKDASIQQTNNIVIKKASAATENISRRENGNQNGNQ